VYFVSKETRKRQHNDKEWKFKEQHAKMWENIAGASAPVVPTPLLLHLCNGRDVA